MTLVDVFSMIGSNKKERIREWCNGAANSLAASEATTLERYTHMNEHSNGAADSSAATVSERNSAELLIPQLHPLVWVN